VSDFVLDASLALQWFLEDETDRQYSLQVLDTSPRAARLSRSFGFMKSAMACSWRIGGSGSPWIKWMVSLRG
jgi:hypothetical protein